ncbi:MAG: aldo/keto reductase [Epulopiscium sp. Nuni2H_MBin001]|nr:MAG: aldo/keto reductase [Epulopiscium sp. Nuni2H_MBin001]
MRKIDIGNVGLMCSEISLGCMRMAGHTTAEIAQLVDTAINCGINFFDHADIYGRAVGPGESERIFAQAVKELGIKRDALVLQSKCGIVPGVMYDFSKEHILTSVESSLKRLNTDYLDILLLHRPDTLMDIDEVAEAFKTLYDTQKVRYFGVSNHNALQMQLVAQAVPGKIVANQLQLSLTNTSMIDCGLNVNRTEDAAINRDDSILEYCRLNKITIQAWSPFQSSKIKGVFLNHAKYPKLNKEINELAQQKGVTDTAIAVAWILRHPANIQVIVGTTNKERLAQMTKATNTMLTREEWYKLYCAAGNVLP